MRLQSLGAFAFDEIQLYITCFKKYYFRIQKILIANIIVIEYYDPWPEKYRMAQVKRKLPSEAKPRMVNCDLGHFFFMAKGPIRFFCFSGGKLRFPWPRSSQEIVFS